MIIPMIFLTRISKRLGMIIVDGPFQSSSLSFFNFHEIRSGGHQLSDFLYP